MFNLISVGDVRSDCTAPYNVELDRVCTVREFISEVLTKNEWGYIEIDGQSEDFTDRIFGNPRCFYKGNEVTYTFPDEWLDKTVKSVKADGGWSNMDYLITVEEEA